MVQEDKVENRASRIIETQMRFKARFSFRKVFLINISEYAPFYSRIVAKTKPNPRNLREMSTNFARDFSCGSKRN